MRRTAMATDPPQIMPTMLPAREVAGVVDSEVESAVAIDQPTLYEEGGEALARHHEQHEG